MNIDARGVFIYTLTLRPTSGAETDWRCVVIGSDPNLCYILIRDCKVDLSEMGLFFKHRKISFLSTKSRMPVFWVYCACLIKALCYD